MVTTVPLNKKSRQAKTAFIIRDTPAWLDQRQSWISDGGRELYKALRTLMDQKTGRLLIPGAVGSGSAPSSKKRE